MAHITLLTGHRDLAREIAMTIGFTTDVLLKISSFPLAEVEQSFTRTFAERWPRMWAKSEGCIPPGPPSLSQDELLELAGDEFLQPLGELAKVLLSRVRGDPWPSGKVTIEIIASDFVLRRNRFTTIRVPSSPDVMRWLRGEETLAKRATEMAKEVMVDAVRAAIECRKKESGSPP